MATLRLDIDELESAVESSSGGSIIARAIADGVETEKCVVPQYRTSVEQKEKLIEQLKTAPRTRVPIEWVIDIADETNGWFYGTAYDYNDETQTLHVMVPDKHNPTFDGEVLLDYRAVHLIECVDGKTDALFNKIVRESIVKVRWDVEWLEEDQAADPSKPTPTDNNSNKWISSSARYLIRIANQLLVEDDEFAEGAKGYVMLNADVSLRLLRCHKGKGLDDFVRLIHEGIVSSSEEAMELVRQQQTLGSPKAVVAKPTAAVLESPATAGGPVVSVKKLSDSARSLRDCLQDIQEEREHTAKQLHKLARRFREFALSGNLDAGLELMEAFEGIEARKGKIRLTRGGGGEDEEVEIDGDGAVDEAFYLVKKIDKGIEKLSGGQRSTSELDDTKDKR